MPCDGQAPRDGRAMPCDGQAPRDGRAAGQRIDKWLWFARLFRARERAARFIEEGRLRLERPGAAPERVVKPSQLVRPGDVVIFAQGGAVRVLRIEQLGRRRGPPAEAKDLYNELGHPDLGGHDPDGRPDDGKGHISCVVYD